MEKDIKNLNDKFDLVLELMKNWFEAMDQKFEIKLGWIEDKFSEFKIETRNNFNHVNQRLDYMHDDYRDIKRQNEKIENELVKPIQKKTAIKHLEFTSVWWFVSFLIAIVASWLTLWMAKAFWN